ncbi:hypothetical protein Glove_521g44 [Diversispora epigaea]|uniref:Uncharacterized protein n=1 Tax=Diversispora epigaea TaxID=1348612 RepID=A0A397GJ10_9GLOM|nr:hypothetical protein Glove_521g44 [Diversispora epigaea]
MLYLKEDIMTLLLEKLWGMRGGIASRVKSAIFEIFGESQLPRIDFQSSPAEINSWKSNQRVKDAYRKHTCRPNSKSKCQNPKCQNPKSQIPNYN